MKAKLAIGALFATLFFTSFAYSQALTREGVVRLKKSTVYIKSKFVDGVATGSGFLVARDEDSGYIATNAHVVSQRLETLFGAAIRNAGELKVVFYSGQSNEREL